MILKGFQEAAIKDLLTYTGQEKLLILDAPTGAGKTIILVNYIDRLLEYKPNTVVVWFTPGKGELEEQSKDKMDRYIITRATKTLDDVLTTGFDEQDTVFINWEKVVKSGNLALKDTERDNLKDKVAKAKLLGLEFVLIIDEEHSNDTKKAKGIMDIFDSVTQIRASATPENLTGVKVVKITEKEAIRAGLITKAIYINEGLADGVATAGEVEVLLKLAIAKQKEISKRYRLARRAINPLVLIQVPNKDEAIIKRVEDYLADQGYTYANKRVAKWLSDKGDKINISEAELGHKITEPNAEPIFLIMKQAISLGWDAPRAKILVKLRTNMSETFSIQTIGRIRRMPEGKHYDDTLLDTCYLYTCDQEYVEGVKWNLKDNCKDVMQVTLKDAYRSFELTKEWKAHKLDFAEEKLYDIIHEGFVKKYGLGDFERNQAILEDKFNYVFGTELENKIISDVTEELTKESLKNLKRIKHIVEVDTTKNGLDYKRAILDIDKAATVGYDKLNAIFRKLFLEKYKVPNRLLNMSLRAYYAFIINNRWKLTSFINEILKEAKSKTTNKDGDIEEKVFKFPVINYIGYDKAKKNIKVYAKNVYENYPSTAIRSTSEWLFEKHCEMSPDVKWFFKNGEDKTESFCILYYDKVGKLRYFYPDYIVMTADDKLWIIETKGGETDSGENKDIDNKTPEKFEYLKEYAKKHGVNFGFVRDLGGRDLVLNNTEYIKNLSDSKWVAIETVF